MRSLILLLALFCCCTSFYAQSGYLGRRISVGYSFEFFPYLGKLILPETYGSSSRYDDQPFIIWSTGHHVNGGLVLNRKLELLADVGLRRLKYRHQSVEFRDDHTDDAWQADALSDIVNETSAEIGLRYYFKEFVAPVGIYHQATFGVLNVALDKKISEFSGHYYDFAGRPTATRMIPVGDVQELKVKRLNYGIGVKKILTGNVYLNLETNIHFIFGAPSRYYRKSSFEPYSNVPVDEYGQYYQNYSFSTFKRFDIKFGIGLLL
jgi:hypothetical protein